MPLRLPCSSCSGPFALAIGGVAFLLPTAALIRLSFAKCACRRVRSGVQHCISLPAKRAHAQRARAHTHADA
eukprot:7629599-Alexandrium_andersonii.AAC.1